MPQFASDKLPAVAGIASEFCKLKSGEYVAGLWRNDYFRSHLAWSGGSGKCRRSSDYRAPSWSGASTDGEIRTPSIKRWEPRGDVDKRALPLLCDIVDCWVVPKNGENPLGEVKTGVLTLRGCMRRAVVSQSHVHDQDTGQKLGYFNLDDPSKLASLPKVWCMPLLHERDARLHCLAMRPATEEEGRCARGYGGVEKSVFRRVGIVEPFWRDAMPGDREYTNYRVEAGSVYAELTESRSSIRALLDWFEG